MKNLIFAAFACAALLAASCTKTIYVPVENTRTATDTLRLVAQRADTLRLSDTLLIYRSGDTLLRESIHWRERVRVQTDTVVHLRGDTISRKELVVQEPAQSAARKSSITNLLWRLALLALLLVALLFFLKNFLRKS